MKLTLLLAVALLASAVRAADSSGFADVPDTAALRTLYTPFDANNPAPAVTLDRDGDAKVMTLKTSGGPGDKVIVRDLTSPPPAEIKIRLRAAAGAPAGAYAYIALRPGRNSPNLLTQTIHFTPGQWQEITIPNQNRFHWRDRFSLLICLHDEGKPLTVEIGALTLAGVPAAARPFAETPEAKKARVKKLLSAKTTQISTDFPYYQNRSAASIASELEVNGFDGVYYFATSDRVIIPGLVGELQRRGLAVGLMTLPSLVYWSEKNLEERLPAGWRNWMIQFTDDRMKDFRFVGFVHPEYNAWYKPYLVKMLKDHGFDGFTFAEIMYPIYDGPERAKPLYGDVNPAFQAAFKKATGNTGFPNFIDPADPDYFKTNTKLYRELVEYRVKTINDFYDDIINGAGGARENVPGIVFATWTLGINIPDGVAKLREWEGNDIGAMIRQVKPDMHFIQTHAPDWLNPKLPGDYVNGYKPFFDAIRAADPGLKVGLQTDVGSRGAMRRDPAWMKDFYRTCREQGVDSTTYYEFCLRWEVYNTAPELRKIRKEGEELVLIFDQRLAAEAARVMAGRKIGKYGVLGAEADGNTIRLKLDAMPAAGERLTVPVGGIADDPAVRLNLSNVPPMPKGPVNRVPDGTEVTLPVD